MSFVKKNIVVYCLITIAFVVLMLFCDTLFLNSAITGDISRNVYSFFYQKIGNISFTLFVTVFFLGVLSILFSSKIPIINWYCGIGILFCVIPALFEFLKLSTVTGGEYGKWLNALIAKSGVFAYFIYGILVFISFFVFLFPYRYILSKFAIGVFANSEKKDKIKSDKVYDKSTNKTNLPPNQVEYSEYYQYEKNSYNNRNKKTSINPNFQYNPPVKKKNDTTKPPFITKVVCDKNSRTEYPCFNSDEKPKKYIFDTEDENFVYFKQVHDDEKTKAIVKPDSPKEYYSKSKEFFPDWWNNNKNEDKTTDTNQDTHSTNALVTQNQFINDEKLNIQDEELISEEKVVTSLDFNSADSNLYLEETPNITLVNDESQSFSQKQTIDQATIKNMIDEINIKNAEEAIVVEENQLDEDEFDNEMLIDDQAKTPDFSFDNGENKFQFNTEQNLPDFNLLQEGQRVDTREFEAEEKESARILEATLLEFKIKATVSDIIHGPTVTLFKVVPAAGVKLTLIEGLSNNLAMRLSAKSIRIIAPIPGESVVGIEIPNRTRENISFKEIVDSPDFVNTKMNIPIGIGKDIYGNIIMLDMYKMPHILIAGATGSGKSVCVNSFICSILCSRSPDEVRMILIDPKIVELKPYNDIPHLLTPVITDSKDAITALKYLVFEMERRYSLLGDMGVRDIVEYRNAIKTKRANMENLPFIVAFVDEFADLMTVAGKETETLFARITAKARAVGILLVLATQRPSTDVITGLIKANVPARIAFQVISLQDSRIILDQKGAEKLLGQGDMLYLSPTQPFPTRVQGAFLSKDEVDLLSDHWKSIAQPEYINLDEMIADFENEEDGGENFTRNNAESKDPLFEQALEIARQTGKVSASYLQRRLSIGYNRAANIVETMEDLGMVGPANGSKPRDFLG